MSNAKLRPHKTLRSLSKLLIEPISISKNTRDIILVLHRNLHSLAFAALPIVGSLPAYEPLAARYNLKVIPSLSAYLMEKKQSRTSAYSLELAVFANPELAQVDHDSATGPDIATPSAHQRWTRSLSELPRNESAANNLEKLFINKRYLIYTGRQANRKN